MQQDMFWLVAAVSMVVIAVSVAVIAWALVRLAAEAGRTADETDGLLQVLREELPPTLAAVERAAASIDQLAGEGAGALATFDTLATEAESTMVAVRELSGSVNDIVRGPADTVTGVKRSARMVGGGIASGADRLRRVITGEHDEE
jgi:uncharacterized protein YoxC